MNEFGLIQKIKDGEAALPNGFLGIGDDCAALPQRSGYETVISTDALIEETHFLLTTISAYDLGWKSAAVNLSDIAAMGAYPSGIFLTLAIPMYVDDKWLESFIAGFRALCRRWSCPILGGDTVKSHSGLMIDVTVTGNCPVGRARRRSFAEVGDEICVLGTLGDSAAGLRLLSKDLDLDADGEFLLRAHRCPQPMVDEGVRLAETAGVHAMMDVSDGIGSDLRHILKASGVGAEVDCAAIPVSEQLSRVCERYGWDKLELALNGGEDYVLLFTKEAGSDVDLPYTVIGRITAGSDLKWLGSARDYVGFRHF